MSGQIYFPEMGTIEDALCDQGPEAALFQLAWKVMGEQVMVMMDDLTNSVAGGCSMESTSRNLEENMRRLIEKVSIFTQVAREHAEVLQPGG